MDRCKLIIPAIPPSNNEFLANSHHYRIYAEKKEEWHWLVKTAIRRRPPKPFSKAVVAITYFFPDRRRRDPDNYSGKFILDALVKEKILEDDNFYTITLVLGAEVDRKNPRTEIEIERKEDEGK